MSLKRPSSNLDVFLNSSEGKGLAFFSFAFSLSSRLFLVVVTGLNYILWSISSGLWFSVRSHLSSLGGILAFILLTILLFFWAKSAMFWWLALFLAHSYLYRCSFVFSV